MSGRDPLSFLFPEIQMKQRIITGAVLIALLVPVLVFSYTPVFAVMFTLLAVAATWEMLKCVGTVKRLSAAIPAYIYTLIVNVAAKCFMPHRDLFAWTYIAATFFFFMYLAVFSMFSKGKFPVDEMFAAFGGVFYVASAFAAFILLRESYLGEYLYLVALFFPLLSDTFAYFVGVSMGKHKLIPDVSPKKTVEGCVGAIVLTGVAAVVFVRIMLTSKGFGASVPQYFGVFVAGAALSVLSQIGDLLASFIKRRYGIKDYGFIFPGHGGVLDRLDSVLLASPLMLFLSFILQYISVHEL